MFLFFLIVISSVYGKMELETLRELCPDDKEFCALKALQGDCFGASLKSSVMRKQCECTCDELHHDRIQSCCNSVGKDEMKFCLPLCGYNTTVQQISSTLGLRCVSQLTTWAYCASDAQDNTPCCITKGVPSECHPFCQGVVPTCDIQSIFSYESCLVHIRSIVQCQKEGLGQKAMYNPEWKGECDMNSITKVV